MLANSREWKKPQIHPHQKRVNFHLLQLHGRSILVRHWLLWKSLELIIGWHYLLFGWVCNENTRSDLMIP